jgi:hypothetical protein
VPELKTVGQRTVAEGYDTLNKEQTSYDYLLEELRLSLKDYNIKLKLSQT